MQISLRSQLMAGAFAVVGTTAIVIAPAAQQSLALEQIKPLHNASVELAAFANPVNAILGTLDLVNNDLFNSLQEYPGGIPVGIIPQLLDDPLPAVRQVGDNLSYYAGNAIASLVTGPTSSLNVAATLVWTLPAQLGEAFTELISGDFQGALETLAQTFIAPIPYIIDGFVNAIQTPVVNVFDHVLNLVTSVPGIISSGIDTLVGGLSLLADTTINGFTDVVTNLLSLNFEGAWNAGVDSFLSPGGVLGRLEQLTIGPGYDDGTTYYNSIRGWITETQNTVVNAISTVASTDAEETAAPATAVAPSAAKVAAAAADAGDSAKDDSSVADGAKAAAAGDNSDAASAPAVTAADNDNAAAGDSKADAKADNGGKTGAGTAKSGSGKGHGKSHGSARKAADN